MRFWFVCFLLMCSRVVFAHNDSVFVSNIFIIGNTITKEKIIRRELLFQQNNLYSKAELPVLIEKSRNNLINTSLFVFADIVYADSLLNTDIIINVQERWYIWPSPILNFAERNFNSWWEHKDMKKINYGCFVSHENFRGRKETLKFIFSLGYDQELGIAYKIPYINKKQTIGVGLEVHYRRNNELVYDIMFNKPAFFKTQDGFAIKKNYFIAELAYRPSIYHIHTIQIQYQNSVLSDSIQKLNSFYVPDALSSLRFSTLHYQLKVDYRNYKSYPTQGYYFDFESVASVTGNFTNSFLRMFYIRSNYRYYNEFNKRWGIALGTATQINQSTRPVYSFQQGMGYNNYFVRGYEYYIMNGQYWNVSKLNLRYVLIPTRIEELPYINLSKFKTMHYAVYLNWYADAGYVKDTYFNKNNTLHNVWLAGTGVGIDFVTYYDKVMRIEYSLNKHKQHGVFLHFIAPI